MKKLLLILPIALIFSSGCARFKTKQTDYSYEYDATKGKVYPVRKITTVATASTLLDAKSKLTTWKASQTDKTQGAIVGDLNQESYGTNAVKIIEAVTEGVVKGLTKSVVPIP